MKKSLFLMMLVSPIFASEQKNQEQKNIPGLNNYPQATPRVSMMKKFQEQEEKDGTLYLTREQLLALVKPIIQESK